MKFPKLRETMVEQLVLLFLRGQMAHWLLHCLNPVSPMGRNASTNHVMSAEANIMCSYNHVLRVKCIERSIFVLNPFASFIWCKNPSMFVQALAQQYSSELLQAELERTRINIACFMEPLDSVPETLKPTYTSFRGTVDSPSRNHRAQPTGSPAFSRQRRR